MRLGPESPALVVVALSGAALAAKFFLDDYRWFGRRKLCDPSCGDPWVAWPSFQTWSAAWLMW